MADDKSKQPIFIKKKKGGHAGAHGGAWKIAYADLVTAMMAFFLVMWIIGMDVETKQGIAEYFQNMSARSTHEPASPHLLPMRGVPQVKPRIRPVAPRDNNLDKANAERLKSRIDSLIGSTPQLERLRGSVDMQIGELEMRIDLHDGGETSPFTDAGHELRLETKNLLTGIGALLSSLRHRFYIEGHSGISVQGEAVKIDRWRSTTDRAAEVRAALGQAGIVDDRILAVSGFADTRLKFIREPINPGNSRVSIVIPYDLPDEQQATP